MVVKFYAISTQNDDYFFRHRCSHHFCGLHFTQKLDTKTSGTQYAHELIYVIFIPAAH